jgi:hypothetical protein
MNSSQIADLIRRWVDVYTRGMAAPVRAARRDEVDDDLWCHHEEAAEAGRSDNGLGSEMLLRLLFGMPADLSWRLAHGRNAGASHLERRPSTSTRVLGTLAILAGVSWTALMLAYSTYGELAWAGQRGNFMWAFTVGGGLAFTGTAFGLLWRFQEQLDRLGFMGGASAGLGGFAAAFNGAWVIVLLPVGSVALVWDLARIGALSFGMATLHTLGAVGLLVVLAAAFGGDPVTGLGLLGIFGPAYPLSWIAIGASLWRGVPSPRAGSGLVSDQGP